METPFTGRLFDTLEVGTYNCRICDNSLFLSEHKYITETGYATFWGTIKN